MSFIEILGGIFLVISGLFLIIVVLLQESKQDGLSGSVQGGSVDSYLNTSGNRTREAVLKRTTKFFAVVFFMLSIFVNIFEVFSK